MNVLRDLSSRVCAPSYPTAAKTVVFQTPATRNKILESDSRVLADCRHDRHVLDKMVFSAFMFCGNDTFGYIHHRPGIVGFLAKLLVGNMYHVRCFNVHRGILPWFRTWQTND